jgi:hypothetical protein
MRRLLLLFVAVIGLVRPVFADDMSVRLEDVRQQLTAASAQITDLDNRLAALERSATDTQTRIDRERAQVRLLARALYVQPDSLAATIFESASVAEALTRISDLTSAGDRAAATKRLLDADQSRLSAQRTQMQSDQKRQEQLKKQLEEQFAKLVAAGAQGTTPVPPAVPLQAAAGAAAIQQIIMDAFAYLGSAAQTWALRVGYCESHYNPYAVNRSSGASGLFQFLPSTWANTPQHASSPFDPVANAQAAAWLYHRSGPGQWVCQ